MVGRSKIFLKFNQGEKGLVDNGWCFDINLALSIKCLYKALVKIISQKYHNLGILYGPRKAGSVVTRAAEWRPPRP